MGNQERLWSDDSDFWFRTATVTVGVNGGAPVNEGAM